MKIAEILLEVLSNVNEKPSYNFDLDYGTSISKQYEFPFGYSEDEVWLLYKKCRSSGNESKYCKEMRRIVDNLNETHFSYLGVNKLPFKIRLDIILGMCSRFNVDDIIWFSINGVFYGLNNDVNKLISRYFPNKVRGLGWVVSPPTINKILTALGYD